MRSLKTQVFIISLVVTGALGAAIAFSLKVLPAWGIIGIAVVVGAVSGGILASMIREPGKRTCEAIQSFRQQGYRAPVELGGDTALEKELLQVFSEVSAKLQTTQEEFQRKCQDSELFIEFSKMMIGSPSEGKILPLVLDKVSNHLGAKSASVLLLDQNTNELIARAVQGNGVGLEMGQRIPSTEGVYAQVLQSKKATIQRRGVRDRVLARIAPQGQEEDFACIPLQVDNRPLGLLNVQGKKDGTGFTHDDSEFLTFLANGTAMVLKQSLLQHELTQIFLGIVKAMVQAVDARDRYTRNHSTRVSDYSMSIARALRYDPNQLDEMLFASLLHDIGKLGVPDNILNKPAKLTTEEFEIIKSHTVRGVEILGHLETQLPWNILPVVRNHHERWDGRGYPDGLYGENINYNARVVAIADVFDAITSDRSYRAGMPLKTAVMEIRRGIATHFDPKLIPVAAEVLQSEYPRIVETFGLS